MKGSVSPYTTMTNDSGNLDHLSDYYAWDERQLGTYFRKRGLGDYFETIQKHKITGQLAPLLGDEDLKEMGVNIVGDRLMFKHHLQDLSRRERYNKRIQSLWEGTERIFFSECDKQCFTCNGFCPVDPSTCKLLETNERNGLWKNIKAIKTSNPFYFSSPATCCQTN